MHSPETIGPPKHERWRLMTMWCFGVPMDAEPSSITRRLREKASQSSQECCGMCNCKRRAYATHIPAHKEATKCMHNTDRPPGLTYDGPASQTPWLDTTFTQARIPGRRRWDENLHRRDHHAQNMCWPPTAYSITAACPTVIYLLDLVVKPLRPAIPLAGVDYLRADNPTVDYPTMIIPEPSMPGSIIPS